MTCIPNTRQHYRRQHTISLHDVVARVVSIRVAVRAYLDMILVESKPLLGPRGLSSCRFTCCVGPICRDVHSSVRPAVCRPETSTRPDCARKLSCSVLLYTTAFGARGVLFVCVCMAIVQVSGVPASRQPAAAKSLVWGL